MTGSEPPTGTGADSAGVRADGGAVHADSGGIAAGGDVHISAQSGSVAAGSIHGPVMVIGTYYERQAAGHPVRLEPRVPHVAGRDELLAEVEKRFSAGRPGAPSTVALVGLGGVGKTTAAMEYAHRHVAGYGVVWLLHAEETTALLQQFHELAEVLDAGDATGRSDPVARVHAALAARDDWLLVLDNVRDHATAGRWLPAKGGGHLLITTQDGHWPAAQAIEVGALTLPAAAGYLVNQAADPDTAAAEAVATELGLLPLALAQAAGYMSATGRGLADYLRLLRGNRAQVLARGAPTGHSLPVVATWQLALDQLAASTPEAVELLRLLAFCAPEDIPFRTLLAGGPALPGDLEPAVAARVQALRDNEFTLDDAVAGLRRHSLVGPPSQVLSVHRLVQAVTRDSLTAAEQSAWRAAAAALVRAAIPKNTGVRAAWPVCAQLLPHAQLLLDPLSYEMWRLANYLGAAGDHATGLSVWRWLAEAHSRALGAEHPDTLTARNNVAAMTGELGDAATARDLFTALLAVQQRVSGEEDQETLTVWSNLARWTGQAGDPAEARRLFAELVQVRERVLGPEHPETLSSLNNLGFWTGQTGDAVAARDLFAQLLPVRVGKLGADDPNTLVTLSNVAHWTGQAGDPVAGRDLFAQLVPVRERVLGAKHPDTLTSRGNLAYWTGVAGDPVAARDQYAALLPVMAQVRGDGHPETVKVRNGLAYWTEQARLRGQ